MRRFVTFTVLIILLLAYGVVRSANSPRPPVPPEWVELWERFQRALLERGNEVRDWLGGRNAREARPVISIMLNNRDRLGLTDDQVKKLEQVRDTYERQAIRNESESRIVELDIATLLEAEPVDIPKVDAKIREAEKLHADLRIARIRAAEQARGLLNAEQKKKFEELTPPPRPQP